MWASFPLTFYRKGDSVLSSVYKSRSDAPATDPLQRTTDLRKMGTVDLKPMNGVSLAGTRESP
jgi:hypothetical protein